MNAPTIMLRPDRHRADGPVFSVVAQGGVQAFVPLPGVTAAFQRPGEDRIEGPVIAGPHTHAAMCRVWADGPVAVIPLSAGVVARRGMALPRMTGRLVGASHRLVGDLMTPREDLEPADAPDEPALSLRQRQRRVLAQTGLTPGALSRLARLQAARIEVLGADRPLAEIALDHGFHDQAHFTTAYRLWTGVTPGADRRRASPDVVFLQDSVGWVPLTDRMIEVG